MTDETGRYDDGADRSRRPSEAQLVDQLGDMREAMFAGFETRDAVLEWAQKLTVRTLGHVSTRRYRELAESFMPDSQYAEGPLLAALLVEEQRTRPLNEDAVQTVREEWAADTIATAQVDAFRAIRAKATEYVGSEKKSDENQKREEETGHDPSAQDYAMRPALKELHEYQRAALTAALDGFDERGDILTWGDDLAKATRGEPVGGVSVGEFVPACYHDERRVRILTASGEKYDYARQYYLAHWLLPAFNAAAQDLSQRATEEPADDRGEGHGPGGVA